MTRRTFTGGKIMVDGMSTESIRSDAQDTSDRLILITLGRYSGRHHASLLQYRRYGTDLLVIATNDRQRAKPDWYLDIKEEPIVLRPRHHPDRQRTRSPAPNRWRVDASGRPVDSAGD
jgi:hypothetical protein